MKPFFSKWTSSLNWGKSRYLIWKTSKWDALTSFRIVSIFLFSWNRSQHSAQILEILWLIRVHFLEEKNISVRPLGLPLPEDTLEELVCSSLPKGRQLVHQLQALTEEASESVATSSSWILLPPRVQKLFAFLLLVCFLKGGQWPVLLCLWSWKEVAIPAVLCTELCSWSKGVDTHNTYTGVNVVQTASTQMHKPVETGLNLLEHFQNIPR